MINLASSRVLPSSYIYMGLDQFRGSSCRMNTSHYIFWYIMASNMQFNFRFQTSHAMSIFLVLCSWLFSKYLQNIMFFLCHEKPTSYRQLQFWNFLHASTDIVVACFAIISFRVFFCPAKKAYYETKDRRQSNLNWPIKV